MANRFEKFLAPNYVGGAETASEPAPAVPAENRFSKFTQPQAVSAPAVKEDILGQAGAGIVTGIPNAVTGIVDMALAPVTASELGKNDETVKPGSDAEFTAFMAQKYGVADPKVPNGWTDDQRQAAWKEFAASGAAGDLKAPTPTVGEYMQQGLTAAHLNPNDYFRPPATPGERIARLTGEGAVTSVLSPNKAAGWAKLVQAAKEFGIGAASGAGAGLAMEVTPDEYKPLAGLAGGLAGGVGGMGLNEAAGAAGRAAKGAAEYVAPALVGRAGREKIAGKQLGQIVGDTDATIDALSNADELVPGSKPTAFQATGNVGIGSLEKALARGDDDFKRALLERQAQQNEARVAALDAVQESGNPAMVADFFRSRMHDLEKHADELYDVAETKAKGAYEGLGERGAGEIGDQARSAMEANFKNLNSEANKLWNSIDPDGTMNVLTKPLVNGTARIYGAMSPEEMLSLSAAEKDIAAIIGGYGETLPFNRFKDLRSQISEAMRDAKMTGKGRAYGRLSQLRSAVEDAVSDSIAGKMEADPSLAEAFVRRARDWYENGVNREAGTGAAASPMGTATGTARAVSEGAGAASPEVGVAAGVESGSGLSPDASARRAVEGGGRFEQAAREYPTAPRDEWYGEANYESAGGKMTEMTPDEFLARARPLEIDDVARDNIDDLKRHIQSGKTLDPLKFFEGGKEDGRHRAIAAKELGIKRVPVIEFGDQVGAGRKFEQAAKATQTSTPEFKRWFGKSAVVDESGAPLRVYHGTLRDVSEFDVPAQGVRSYMGIPTEVTTHGVFFSPDPEFASSFAKQPTSGSPRKPGSPNVMPAYLSLKNPLIVKAAEGYNDGSGWRTAFPPEAISALKEQGFDERWLRDFAGDPNSFWEQFDDDVGAEFVDGLKKAGYDGVKMQEYDDAGKLVDSYVAFDPKQIKSATANRGTFDPTDPNILNQSGDGAASPASAARTPAADLPASDKPIANTMAKRFAAAGRSEPEARAAGELVDAFYTTAAKRLGKTVEQVQEQFPLPKVQKGGGEGGLNQGAQTTDTPEARAKQRIDAMMDRARIRASIPAFRGGATMPKITKTLRSLKSDGGGRAFASEIRRFDSPDQVMENLYFHGTGGFVDGGLKAGSVLPENAFRSGGYDERQNSISLSKSKEVASNFTGDARSGTVHSVLLKKGAAVEEHPEWADAMEVEDHLPDLWNRGIDAVKIGDWKSPHSEQELVVLNPRALSVGPAENFSVFQKKKFDQPTIDDAKQMMAEYAGKYPASDQLLFQPAWHGSPHIFDKFKWSDETRGKGEGAQAFGDGLYFAGRKGVAEYYRDALSSQHQVKLDGKSYRNNAVDKSLESYGLAAVSRSGDVDASIQALRASADITHAPAFVKRYREVADWLEANRDRISVSKNKGRLYKVDIPDDSELMAWDKPLSEQSPAVKEKLAALGFKDDGLKQKFEDLQARKAALATDRDPKTNKMRDEKQWHRLADEAQKALDDMNAAKSGEKIYQALADRFNDKSYPNRKAAEIKASAALREAGIPGHRFLDQGSRLSGDAAELVRKYGSRDEALKIAKQRAEDASLPIHRKGWEKIISDLERGESHNYVIYDDSRVNIADYEQNEGGPRGSIQFDPTGGASLIKMFETADASTALHEAGHQFLHMFRQFASAADAPAALTKDWSAAKAWWEKNSEAVAKDAGAGVTPADVRKVLRDNSTGDRMKDLAIDKGLHEQWARAFEVYLRDGKAPNAAMRGVFEQFKDFLTQVYKSVTGMGVNLSPEIRGVFDRMLGGEGVQLLDEAAAKRFKAATAATRNIKETFGAKPVNSIMRRPGNTLPFTMTPEAVTTHLFKPGPEGAANIQAAMKAGAPKDAIESAAVLSAKRSAGKDGALDPSKFEAWRSKHSDALKAMPEIDRKFSDAASATKAMADIGERRAAALNSVRKSAIGKLLGVDAPADVSAAIGSMLNRQDAVKAMRELAAGAAKDPEALEGLRRAVVDHMLARLKTPKDALRADTFQRFLGKNAPALSQVLTPQQMSGMRAIAQDLKRASKDVRAPGGGSDTAENLAAQRKYLHDTPTIAQSLIMQMVGSTATHLAANFVAPGVGSFMTWAAQTLGGTVVQRMREAGITKIDGLIREALLDPDLMKALLMKAPKKPNTGSAITLGQKLSNIAAMNLALSAAQGEEDEPRVRRRDADASPMLATGGN